MNARAYSVAAVGKVPAPLRVAASPAPSEPVDLYPAIGILTGVAVSVGLWIIIAMILIQF
jgi:hypothetical protein